MCLAPNVFLRNEMAESFIAMTECAGISRLRERGGDVGGLTAAPRDRQSVKAFWPTVRVETDRTGGILSQGHLARIACLVFRGSAHGLPAVAESEHSQVVGIAKL